MANHQTNHAYSERPGAGERSRILIGLIPWLSICLVVLLIMLPRLASAQFGLLDDGNTLRTARLVAAGQWRLEDIAQGRSRPFYWLFWSLPYLLAGPSPFWYFVANLASLIALLGCVLTLGRSFGMGILSVWLAIAAFLFTGPVVETFYTLGKGEPLQLIFILLALILVLKVPDLTRGRARLATFVLIPILSLLADVTKETSVVLVPISLGWLVAASLGNSSTGRINKSTLRAAIIGFGVGGAAFFGYRVATVGPQLLGSGYASGFEFSSARVLDSGARWTAWLLRDFLFLVPLALLPVLWRRKGVGPSRADLLVGSLIWMAGWLAIFLPWVFVAEYYLLPFSLGAALFAGMLLGDAIAIVRRRAPSWRVTSALLVLSGLLFLPNLANFVTVARLQLAVDRANAAAVEYLAQSVPPNGTVIVNIQEPTEYVGQMMLLMSQLHERPDIRIVHLDLTTFPADEARAGALVAVPEIENQLLFSDRLGVNEPDVRGWNASISELLINSESLYHQRVDVRLLAIDPARVFCPLLTGGQVEMLPTASVLRYCQSGGVIDRRVFSYGWSVYRLERP